MKNAHFPFTLLLLVGILNTGIVVAQEAIPRTSRPSNQSIYAELGGHGLIFSFNYDARFSPKPDGIGGRIGIGGFALGDDIKMLTIPVGINYLAGNNGKYFEGGLGAVYSSGGFFDNDRNFGKVFGVITFGYRKQPNDGGFTFRAAITPIFGTVDNEAIFYPWMPSVSFGYAF